MTETIENEVKQWLERVVIGLNLCPFAKKPSIEKRVRFVVSQASSEEVLLAELQDEMEFLEQTSANDVETSLLIIPSMLQNFYDYNDFLDLSDSLLSDRGWEGVFQVASFHPDYCFAGVDPDSVENYTNRSPYPILHVLREVSLDLAIDHYQNVDEIPEKNIETMHALSDTQIKALFSSGTE